jgi:ABC-type antimicrobial peptide transport system permease subunit
VVLNVRRHWLNLGPQLLEVIGDGFTDARANAGRTALQTLGVILGVASVVGTMGLTAGGRAQSMKYMAESGGVLKVSVYPQPPDLMRISAKAQASRGLTLDDVEAVRASIPAFDIVEAEVNRRLPLTTPRASKTYRVAGVAPLYAELHELRIERGRFITAEDIISSSAVCVLGADRAHEFFGSADPIGHGIRIGGHYFRVAGVMAYREFYWNRNDTYNGLGWMNELILVPVTTMLAREVGAGQRKVDYLGMRLANIEAQKEATPALRRLLIARHGVEDFRVYDRQERLEQMNQEGKIYDITFLVCGIISLVVGGIVVANILMASFTERMREVGVRKALGAKGWQIFVQGLVESAIVTGIGGAAGLVLGVGFVHGMAYLIDQPAALAPSMVMAAVVSAVVVGVVFGFFPAFKASRLDPVVALRYE